MAPLSALLLLAGAALAAAQHGPWDARLYLHSNATAERLNAYCIDGSKGGFYYRTASSPAARNKWKLHFMGGGWATAPEWLLTRSRGATGSSKSWGPWLGAYWGFFGLDSLNDTSVNIVGDWNFVWFFVRGEEATEARRLGRPPHTPQLALGCTFSPSLTHAHAPARRSTATAPALLLTWPRPSW